MIRAAPLFHSIPYHSFSMKLKRAALGLALCVVLALPAGAITPEKLRELLGEKKGEAPPSLRDESGPGSAPDTDPVVTREFPLRYAEARTLNIIQSTASSPGPVKIPGVVDTLLAALYQKPVDAAKDTSRAPSIPNVFWHRTKNAVVVVDRQSHMPFYEQTIRKLDCKRPLIEISVAIIDINSDASLSFGTELLAGISGTVSEGTGALRAGSFVTQGGDLNPLVDGLNTAAGALPTTPLSPTLVEGQQFSVAGMIANSTSRFVGRLRTLEHAGKAHVMTRPSILTLANSEATFSDDTHLFIPVPGVNFANIYEVPVITQIKVVPRLVKEGEEGTRQIQLVVIIDDSAIATSGDPSLAGIPMVQSSNVSSQAVVSEAGSLLVAGRYRHDQSRQDARAPILGRIPVLGLLFKQKSVIKNRSQRFYLITPRIVDSQLRGRGEDGKMVWSYDQAANSAADAMLVESQQPLSKQIPLSPDALRRGEKARQRDPNQNDKAIFAPQTKPQAPSKDIDAEPVARHGLLYRMFHPGNSPDDTNSAVPASKR